MYIGIMSIPKFILQTVTHLSMLGFGVVLGIYSLPILIAPPSPSKMAVEAISIHADFKTQFVRQLKGSDFLHWGDGFVSLSSNYVTMQGSLAPGPEYKLYLSPEFVETEAEFEHLKSKMTLIGDINTFDNFIIKVKPSVDLSDYNTVIVWCEAFGEFITSAKYREH
jgi:hypothetical protein